MKISIVSTFFVLLATSISAKELEKRVGNYDATCGEVRLDDATMNPQYLTGDCTSNDGQYIRKTRLDLNLCYSPNEDGIMVPTDMGVGLSTSMSFKACVKCFIGNGYELPRTYYACDCTPPDGGFETHSGVDLNQLIENIDGYLTCFNHTAQFLSQYVAY